MFKNLNLFYPKMNKKVKHLQVAWRLAVIILLIITALAFFSDRKVTGSAVDIVEKQEIGEGTNLKETSTGSLDVFFDAVKEKLFKDKP